MARTLIADALRHALPGLRGGTPVFAVKGESLAEYWDYTAKLFDWHGGGMPNMILDDGGDATLLLHLGAVAEKELLDDERRARAYPSRPGRRRARSAAAARATGTCCRRRRRWMPPAQRWTWSPGAPLVQLAAE